MARRARVAITLTKPENQVLSHQDISDANEYFRNQIRKSKQSSFLFEYIEKYLSETEAAKHVKRFPREWASPAASLRAWLILLGNELPQEAVEYVFSCVRDLERRIPELDKIEAEEKADRELNGKPNRDEKFRLALSCVVTEIEGQIDDRNLNIVKVLKEAEAQPKLVHAVHERYASVVKEMQDALAGVDPDLVEGYSHLSKKKLQNEIKFFNEICESCNGYLDTRPTKERKPRRKKVKTKEQIAKLARYCEYDEASGVKSESPDNIVGATVAYVYDAKHRWLRKYVAKPGETLAFNRTSIVGYDEERSSQKRIRKPVVIQKFLGVPKSQVLGLYLAIKAKELKIPSSRTYEHTVYVRNFQ
jgi:hypothetical protein